MSLSREDGLPKYCVGLFFCQRERRDAMGEMNVHIGWNASGEKMKLATGRVAGAGLVSTNKRWRLAPVEILLCSRSLRPTSAPIISSSFFQPFLNGTSEGGFPLAPSRHLLHTTPIPPQRVC